MKRNELAEIKGLDLKALRGKAMSLRDEIASLVMDKNMKKLKDIKMISKKRKDLSQILTITRQQQLLEQLEKETSVEENKVSEDKSKKGEKAGLSKKE